MIAHERRQPHATVKRPLTLAGSPKIASAGCLALLKMRRKKSVD